MLDTPGLLDWDKVDDLEDRLLFDDNLRDPDPNGPGDQGFTGGAKEFDRSTWGCEADSGKTPEKDDLLYLLAYPSLSIDEAAVAFSYVRDKPVGQHQRGDRAQRELDQLVLPRERPHPRRPPPPTFTSRVASAWPISRPSCGTAPAYVPFDVPLGVANATTNAERP